MLSVHGYMANNVKKITAPKAEGDKLKKEIKADIHTVQFVLFNVTAFFSFFLFCFSSFF